MDALLVFEPYAFMQPKSMKLLYVIPLPWVCMIPYNMYMIITGHVLECK